MFNNINCLIPFDFSNGVSTGLLVCAGGFEDRAIAFARKLPRRRCAIEDSLILRYQSQKEDNETNLNELTQLLESAIGKKPHFVSVNADNPIQSCLGIKTAIEKAARGLRNRATFIDISGMTNLWAISSIHTSLSLGLKTSVIYTEARWYYPPKTEKHKIVRAWNEKYYDEVSKYLQSAGLRAVHIPPEFVGNFRPGKQACLIIFVGYEPNRTEGLIDDYAPGALIVFYGKSPRPEMEWRTQLSKDLHKELFSKWHVREAEISTLLTNNILCTLEEQFEILKEKYDIAIAPQCSKMQAVASYLFWRDHPEVQLLFTSPVRFNPERYRRVRESRIFMICPTDKLLLGS